MKIAVGLMVVALGCLIVSRARWLSTLHTDMARERYPVLRRLGRTYGFLQSDRAIRIFEVYWRIIGCLAIGGGISILLGFGPTIP